MNHRENASPASAEAIEQTAAHWVCRIDLRNTPEEWAALDAWLGESPRHRAAFLRYSAMWRRADNLKRLAPLTDDLLPDEADFDEDAVDIDPWSINDTTAADSEPACNLRLVASGDNAARADDDWTVARFYRLRTNPSANDEGRPSITTRLRHLRARSVALTAAAILLTFVTFGWPSDGYRVEHQDARVYSTRVGDFRRISLEDGSTLTLNTNTEARVRFGPEARRIELIRGEILLNVAKDAARPFNVIANDITLQAVGTMFSVRLRGEGRSRRVDLVVAEGRVAINPRTAHVYGPDTIATVENGRITAETVSATALSRRMSWTTGRLVFEDVPLAEIVDELNRYNHEQIRIEDPDLSVLRLGGVFDPKDPAGFSSTLESAFPIKTRRVSGLFGDSVIQLYGATR